MSPRSMAKPLARTLCLLTVIGIVIGSGGRDSVASEWIIETLDAGDDPRDTSISLTPDGRPAVSYRWHHYLKYREWTGSSWSTQNVQSPTNAEALSLAFDPYGLPSLVVQSGHGFDATLEYARQNANAWDSELLTDPALGASLVIGKDGKPRAAFSQRTEAGTWVTFATRPDDAWQFENVSPGKDVLLALDPTGTPALCFDQLGGTLEYAERLGEWTVTTVAPDGPESSLAPHGLAFDASGNPHLCFVAYIDDYPSHDELRYATRVNGQWIVEPVAETYGRFQAAIDVDPWGIPHIAQATSGGDDLKWWTRTAQGWTFEVVTTGECTRPDATIDPTGAAYIAYVDADLELMLVAMNWASTAVESDAEAPLVSPVRVSPNPFGRATTFEASHDATFGVTVYDPTGRLVWRGRGQSRLTWNARDLSGGRVRAGTYFYRLDADSASPRTGKLLVLQ